MKFWVAGCALLTLAMGCNRPETDRDTAAGDRHSADTVVTKRQMQDTAIVTHDTVVQTDTIRKHGTKAIKRDTVRKQ